MVKIYPCHFTRIPETETLSKPLNTRNFANYLIIYYCVTYLCHSTKIAMGKVKTNLYTTNDINKKSCYISKLCWFYIIWAGENYFDVTTVCHPIHHFIDFKWPSHLPWSKTHVNKGVDSPVSWGSGIHQLHFCWGVRPPNECPRYDIKPFDEEAPALEIWGM